MSGLTSWLSGRKWFPIAQEGRMTCWQSHRDFLAEMRLSAKDWHCSCPLCWAALSWYHGPCLVATGSLPARQSTWKLTLKNKKSRSSWVDAGGKCQLLLVLLGPGGRKEHSCGSWERTTVSMEYIAHGAFYWGSPVEKDIINMWWLKSALPDSLVMNHVLLMNKHSSLSSPVV